MKQTRKIIAKTACLCGRDENGKEGKMHRLLVDDKLQLIAVEHDMKIEKAALVLGGTKPRCLQVIDAWHKAAKLNVTRQTSKYTWRNASHGQFILPTKLASLYRELVKTRKAARRAHIKVIDFLAISTKSVGLATAVTIIKTLLQHAGMPQETINKITFAHSSYEKVQLYHNMALYFSPNVFLKLFLELGPEKLLYHNTVIPTRSGVIIGHIWSDYACLTTEGKLIEILKEHYDASN